MARKPRAEFDITAQDKSAAVMRQAERRLQQVTGNVKTFAFGAAAAIAGVTAGLSALAGRLDSIGKAAETANVSTTAIQELRFAFGQLAQVTDQQVDDSLRRFNRRLGLAVEGSGPAKKTLDDLGIAIRDIGGNLRDTEAVLDDAIQKLTEVESPALRSARASQLFGDDLGPKLAAALGKGSAAVAELRDQFRRDGGVISAESIQNASQFKDQMAQITTVITNQTGDAIFRNAEAIEALANAFGLVVGKSVGVVSTVVNVVRFLGEEVAALVGGIAANDLPRMTGLLVEAQQELRRLTEIRDSGLFANRGLQVTDAQIEAQAELVRQAQQRVDLALRLNSIEKQTAANRPPPPEPPPALPAGLNDAEIKAAEGREEQRLKLKRRFALEFEAETEREAQRLAEIEERQLQESLARAAGFADLAAQEAFARDEQLFLAKMEARAREFEEELALELGFKDARDRTIEEAEQAHQDRLLEIRTREFGTFQRLAIELAKFETKTAREKTLFVLGQAQQLTAGLAANSKAAFNLNKAVSIAEAIVNTATGVTAALRLGPKGIPLAALIAAQGAAQIATIQSTQFGGAASGLTSRGPGTGIPSLANDIAPPPTVSAEERNNATITLRIDAGDSEIARTIFRNARQVADDEDDILFSSRSRQAIEIV